MEKLNPKLEKNIDDLVASIQNLKEYQKCLILKEQMIKNKELMKLIEDVKILQKKYIKSNYDAVIKQKLDLKNSELNKIPIYVIYSENLKVVNEILDFVNVNLNDYFYQKLNS